MAETAGVGLSWYTWLEQGRDINVSPEVLRRVARALHLNATELRHIFQLAGLEVPVSAPPVIRTVQPSLQRLLDSLEYTPAYVHNVRWDRIAWNDAALALMGDFSADPQDERNTLWRTFVKQEVKDYTEDWDVLARELIGEFNASVSQQLDDPWLEDFIERLAAHSPEFRRWRLEREVKPRDSWPTRIRHRSAGLLHLERSVLSLPHAGSLSMVVFVPLDMADSPARLRLAIDEFRQNRSS